MKTDEKGRKKICQNAPKSVRKNDIPKKATKKQVSTYISRHRRMGNSAKESRHHGAKRKKDEEE